MKWLIWIIPATSIEYDSATDDSRDRANCCDEWECLKRFVLWLAEDADHVVGHPELDGCHCYEEAGYCQQCQDVVRLAQNVYELLVEGELFGPFEFLFHEIFVPLFVNRQLADFYLLGRRLWHVWVNNLNFLGRLLRYGILGVSLTNIEIFFFDGKKHLRDWDEHYNMDVEGPLPRYANHHDKGGHRVTDEKASGGSSDNERHPLSFSVSWGERVDPDR